MNVLFVSQCSQNASKETCRILDQFAERCGDRTWKTAITQQGLNTVRKLLKQTARKNTAVACHYFRGADRRELLWIVGNISNFNEQGLVPTNTTQKDILRTDSENQWHTGEDILLLSGIAGLFHDFGKANDLFQSKLKPNTKKSEEPYRHEWVSLRLFQSFVGKSSDTEWLEKLTIDEAEEEQKIIENLFKDVPEKYENPWKTLPPLARSIGWLILSHHRMPQWPKEKEGGEPRISDIDLWMETELHPSWNSPSCLRKNEEKYNKTIWSFFHGTPWVDKKWRQKAGKLASRALRRPQFIKDWLSDPFTLHLARMVLMLSDHYYSSQEPTIEWQNKKYEVYANTYQKTKKYKQKLEEHLIGVQHNAILIAKYLPSFRNSLPSITHRKDFKKRSLNPRFSWQNKAYELAYGLKKRSVSHGFFGVNMASTGCGKTLANARIMYGLSDEKVGCRFSIALGLRSLTLQTGDSLRKQITLTNEDLAILIGSSAVRQLHVINKNAQDSEKELFSGAESTELLFDESECVLYDGMLADTRFRDWLKQSPKLHQLVSAPILVCTIDHLMPATEGSRGGRQIAPMLRLLTSDLVLDEADDFDLDDLPALCRLSNWAGMLGSRILISSATLPPSIIHAMFEAYLSGRKVFQKSCGEIGRLLNVCCAWFDENGVQQSDHAELDSFKKEHYCFTQKKASILAQAPSLRPAKLVPMPIKCLESKDAIEVIADTLCREIHQLHVNHAQAHPRIGRKISVGLVRMANINPMVAVAKQLLQLSPKDGYRIHYCVYHSQYPIAVRSEIEKRLDLMLTRHNSESIWEQPDIQKALADDPEDNHIFVVLATPVAEVGRDHDYDWAIAEPSSMRSLIQLAGRVQRHRMQIPNKPNIAILSQNYLALRNKPIAYTKPGFELSSRSKLFHLCSHDLHEILEPNQFQSITSIPRICPRDELISTKNLVDLEHAHLSAKLFGLLPDFKEHAALWWNHSAHWSFELQRRSLFRNSEPTEDYVLYFQEKDVPPKFHIIEDNGDLKLDNEKFKREDIELAERVSFWGDNNIVHIVEELAVLINKNLDETSRLFGRMSLRQKDSYPYKWFYHQNLGVYNLPE